MTKSSVCDSFEVLLYVCCPQTRIMKACNFTHQIKCQSALTLHNNGLKETQPIRGGSEEVDVFSLVQPARVCMATPWAVSWLTKHQWEICSSSPHHGCIKQIIEWWWAFNFEEAKQYEVRSWRENVSKHAQTVACHLFILVSLSSLLPRQNTLTHTV